jgi:hypothetical protein
MRQFIDGAHQNLAAARAAQQEAHKSSATGNTGGGGTKGKVSLAKAKALPENEGKSDDEIKKHIESLGYEAIP